MLDTKNFVEQLIYSGYSHVCVVPCSFSKHLINAIINSDKIEYISCANESVASSVAVGLKLSGKKVIVLIQSSGLTNAGSCITSLLNPYDILLPIIVSWRSYKEGDSELQHAHLANNLLDLILSYGYQYVMIDSKNTVKAIQQIVDCEEKKTICVLKNNTFSSIDLNQEYKQDLSLFVLRSQFLKQLNKQYQGSDIVFIGTTGNTCREMNIYMQHTNNFYMAGNMGGALSIALGAYLAGKSVIVCGGDAEFVMQLGGMTTASRYQEIDKNNFLIYIVFDNLSNKSTGGQSSYQTHISYVQIANGVGLPLSETVVTIADFKARLKAYEGRSGIFFEHILCAYDEMCPRPLLHRIKDTSMFNR